MTDLYQTSSGSEGGQPDGSGSHQNGSINLSSSEVERSAQLQVKPFQGFKGHSKKSEEIGTGGGGPRELRGFQTRPGDRGVLSLFASPQLDARARL